MNKRLLFAAVFVLGLSLGIGWIAWAATAKELKVIATPSVALYGEPFSWKVTGLQPRERVTLKAASTDARRILWASEAVFLADASGAVDVGRQAPVTGGYGEADIFGLLWSMKATNSDPKKPVAYRHDGVNGWMVDLTATNSVGTTATTRFRCVFQRPGEALVRIPLEQDGLRGFLYYPAEGGPFPGVIILGGSEGGLFEGWAKAFAANGFAALTLAWFGYQSLPEELVEIPVENIAGPILLISGTDDQIWPSGDFCAAIVTRLKQARFPYDVKHLSIEIGGHMSVLPILVTANRGQLIDGDPSGGSPQADARGGYRSWAETIAFLHRHLDR